MLGWTSFALNCNMCIQLIQCTSDREQQIVHFRDSQYSYLMGKHWALPHLFCCEWPSWIWLFFSCVSVSFDHVLKVSCHLYVMVQLLRNCGISSTQIDSTHGWGLFSPARWIQGNEASTSRETFCAYNYVPALSLCPLLWRPRGLIFVTAFCPFALKPSLNFPASIFSLH